MTSTGSANDILRSLSLSKGKPTKGRNDERLQSTRKEIELYI